MENNKSCIQYLHVNDSDEKWGLIVTTVGYQQIPDHSVYPSSEKHPVGYFFDARKGRILSDYQLIYIYSGSGFFESKSCPRKKIEAGTMMLLFPDEWHTYSPGENGWFEFWVGFKGDLIQKWVDNQFFTRENPVFKLGISSAITELFKDIAAYAIKEYPCYQQLISSMVLHLMGEVYFRKQESVIRESMAFKVINEAKALMRENMTDIVNTEEIARNLNVSYSWFRSNFKKYTGDSPNKYLLNLKYLKAKELLCTTDMRITDIAFQLNFENPSQFSTFFQKKEGMSPSTFKKLYGEHQLIR